jgi:hypothetical protein
VVTQNDPRSHIVVDFMTLRAKNAAYYFQEISKDIPRHWNVFATDIFVLQEDSRLATVLTELLNKSFG